MAPTNEAKSIQQKVEALCRELSIDTNQKLTGTIDAILQELGMEGQEGNLMQKVDAALELVGISADDLSMGVDMQWAVQPTRPQLGYGVEAVARESLVVD